MLVNDSFYHSYVSIFDHTIDMKLLIKDQTFNFDNTSCLHINEVCKITVLSSTVILKALRYLYFYAVLLNVFKLFYRRF